MKRNKIKIILITSLLSIFCLLEIINFLNERTNYKQWLEIYKTLSIDEELKNKIITKHSIKGARYMASRVYVTLNNGQNYTINCIRDSQKNNVGINEILQEGDSIYKVSGKDTIIIVKLSNDSVSFKFKLKPF